MNESLVSVIMPVYNSEKYIAEAVLSVCNQTYTNWELWIINDCSSDDSRAIIINLAEKDKRIHGIHLETNSGPAVARNLGIKNANGKYIAFLDADDQWLPEKLSRQVKFMESGNYAFSCTWYSTIDATGKDDNKVIKAPANVRYRQLLKNNTIGCLTAMYDAQQLGRQYMPEIRKRQDYGLWLQILKNGVTVHCLPEVLAKYRKGMHSLSNKKTGVLQYNWEILRKHQQLSLIPAVYYFSCFVFNKTLKYLRS